MSPLSTPGLVTSFGGRPWAVVPTSGVSVRSTVSGQRDGTGSTDRVESPDGRINPSDHTESLRDEGLHLPVCLRVRSSVASRVVSSPSVTNLSWITCLSDGVGGREVRGFSPLGTRPLGANGDGPAMLPIVWVEGTKRPFCPVLGLRKLTDDRCVMAFERHKIHSRLPLVSIQWRGLSTPRL